MQDPFHEGSASAFRGIRVFCLVLILCVYPTTTRFTNHPNSQRPKIEKLRIANGPNDKARILNNVLERKIKKKKKMKKTKNEKNREKKMINENIYFDFLL